MCKFLPHLLLLVDYQGSWDLKEFSSCFNVFGCNCFSVVLFNFLCSCRDLAFGFYSIRKKNVEEAKIFNWKVCILKVLYVLDIWFRFRLKY